MNNAIREKLLNFLKAHKYNLYEEKSETIKEVDVTNVDANDIDITEAGLKYNKKLLMQFLIANSFPLEKAYIDYYAKQFSVTDDGTMINKRVKTMQTKTDLLDSLNDSDLQTYVTYVMLEQAEKLLNPNKPKKVYDVCTVYDRNDGSVDISELERVLSNHAKKGWILKFTFTNELGKNAVAVSGFGVNTTHEQTILIFEKDEEPSDIESKTSTVAAHKWRCGKCGEMIDKEPCQFCGYSYALSN